MSQSLCPCTALLEPWRDGMIDGAQRALLEQHLGQGCGACQAELRYLDWVVKKLRLRAPAIDEVALQRQRIPLIMKAAQQRQRWQTLGQQRLGALKGALGAAALIGLGLLVFDRSPRVSVARISGEGEIRRFTEGEHSIVQLSDGRYELQVSRGLLDRSLLVRLPDGEIEDLGTVFGVTVKGGRTSRVAVREGAVQLRLQGAPDLKLEAGSEWKSGREALAAPAIEPQPAEAPAADGGIGPAALPPAAAHPKLTKHSVRPPAVNHTEDAMYLRMLDLLREDRKEAARGLAQRYLKEFPEGFRRAEVQRIAASEDRIK